MNNNGELKWDPNKHEILASKRDAEKAEDKTLRIMASIADLWKVFRHRLKEELNKHPSKKVVQSAFAELRFEIGERCENVAALNSWKEATIAMIDDAEKRVMAGKFTTAGVKPKKQKNTKPAKSHRWRKSYGV